MTKWWKWQVPLFNFLVWCPLATYHNEAKPNTPYNHRPTYSIFFWFHRLLPEEDAKADNSVYLHFTVLNRHRPWPLSTEEIIGEGFFKYSDMRTDSNEDAVVHLTLPSYRPGTYGHWLVKEIGVSYSLSECLLDYDRCQVIWPKWS